MLKVFASALTAFGLLVSPIELLATKSEENGATFVRLFPVETQNDLSLQLEGVERPEKNENAIITQCGLTDATSTKDLAMPIISALVGSGLKLVVNAIDKRIKQELKKYSASYEGYYGGRAGADGKRYTCWRIVRGKFISSSDREQIDFDAIFALEKDDGATKVYPLRLIMRDPAPQENSRNDIYGIAISLKVVPIIAGKPVSIFDGVLLKDNVTVGNGSIAIRYYLDSHGKCNEEAQETLPILCGKRSESFIAGGFPADGLIQIKAEVGEVGAAPRFLRFFSRTFSGAAEDIGQALADAAAARINPPQPADE